MSSLSYLTGLLGDRALRIQNGSDRERYFSELAFAAENEKLKPDCLYIAVADAARLLMDSAGGGFDSTLFITGPAGQLRLPDGASGGLIATDMLPIELFSTLNEKISESRKAERQIMKAFYERASVYSIIITTGLLLHASMLLLDAGFAVLSRTEELRPKRQQVNQMFSQPVLSYEDINALTGLRYDNLVLERCATAIASAEGHEHEAAIFPFTDSSGRVLYLVALFEDICTGDAADIMRICAGYITRLSLSTQNTNANRNSFYTFLQSALTSSMSEPSALIELYTKNGFEYSPDNRFYRLVMAESCSGTAVTESFSGAGELATALGACGCTVYQGQLVLLLRISSDSFYQVKNLERTDKLLQRHGLRACISASMPIESIRMYYCLLSRALSLDRVMKYKQQNSYFFLDDYNVFTICDLCAAKFADLFGGANPLPLVERCIYMLYRYDKLNNSNLCDTLYNYILTGRNLAKTAEVLYMHKNTVLYKLKKIRSLITEDIDDTSVHTRLIFSFMLLRYYEDYCGGEMPIVDADVDYPSI